ncbi:MAG TPA: DUF1285 domain-containing protein [Candidatus Binataceae bacterium]|nr:DUF1285 domain-containing protein [Candidatus Binataceae bacterium]
MAKAGFYAIESGKISFRRDGNWYTDDERIDNQRIALLFSRSIRRNADGSFFLQVGDERASITVEDTPYVVITVEESAYGGFLVVTNDGEREGLDLATLEVGANNVLYCRVKAGVFRARFLRSAYYHLSDHFVAEENGGFALSVAGRRYPIAIAGNAE